MWDSNKTLRAASDSDVDTITPRLAMTLATDTMAQFEFPKNMRNEAVRLLSHRYTDDKHLEVEVMPSCIILILC